MSDAWNALGECYWYKGDMEEARNCFEGKGMNRFVEELICSIVGFVYDDGNWKFLTGSVYVMTSWPAMNNPYLVKKLCK